MKSTGLLEWLNERIPEIDAEGYLTEHVDRFGVGSHLRPEDLISQSVDLLMEAVRFLKSENPPSFLHPLLVFPLRWSSALRLDVGNLPQELDELEPPSVYLLKNGLDQLMPCDELYRVVCKLDGFPSSGPGGSFRISYQCWANLRDDASESEYVRALYVEYIELSRLRAR